MISASSRIPCNSTSYAAGFEARLLVEPIATSFDTDLERVAASPFAGGSSNRRSSKPASIRLRLCSGATASFRRARHRHSGNISTRQLAVSGSRRREIEDGFASSPANIERDQGVGYDRRSIVSIALRSRISRRRKSGRMCRAGGAGRRMCRWGTTGMRPSPDSSVRCAWSTHPSGCSANPVVHVPDG